MAERVLLIRVAAGVVPGLYDALLLDAAGNVEHAWSDLTRGQVASLSAQNDATVEVAETAEWL